MLAETIEYVSPYDDLEDFEDAQWPTEVASIPEELKPTEDEIEYWRQGMRKDGYL